LKRAIHILFWASLVAASLVFLLRLGVRHDEPTVKEPQPSPAVAAAGSAPVPALPAPVVTPDASSTLPSDSQTISEAALMRQIRDQVRTNPMLAIELARVGRQRFGDSAESDERDKLLVEGLINLQKIGAARVETTYYYRHHPNGRWGNYLFAMTGAHPDPPSGPPK
jgi:hypothetical protein